jgi:hypothetical protein
MELITAEDAASGTVTHWRDSLNTTTAKNIEFKLVIPSFDRPTELCGNTLSLLRRDGVPLDRINVFVSPLAASPGGTPEWYRYVEECKKHHFSEVHVRPGGRTLEEQMVAAMEWVGTGYMIVMSDTVRSIQTRQDTPGSTTRMIPAPKGTVLALIEHGFQLLRATGCTAWSVNPSHNPWQLSVLSITRRLGLLDGNLMGMFLPPNWRKMQVASGHGLIYDVEWSASLWSNGHRFCRYQGVCCDHIYRRPGGQATLMKDATKRRQRETQAIKACAKKFPSLLKWCHKPKASLKTMEYKFLTHGPSGLVMAKTQRGRQLAYSLGAASTSTERMARMRKRLTRRK